MPAHSRMSQVLQMSHAVLLIVTAMSQFPQGYLGVRGARSSYIFSDS